MEVDKIILLFLFAVSAISITIAANAQSDLVTIESTSPIKAIEKIHSIYFVNLDLEMIEKIAKIESSLNPTAERIEPDGRVSVGLMQTLVSTAQDMYVKGYKSYPKPTRASLKDAETSAYFGMAYLDWLQKSYNVTGENLVRGYNGGPGGFLTETGRNLTDAYVAKYRRV